MRTLGLLITLSFLVVACGSGEDSVYSGQWDMDTYEEFSMPGWDNWESQGYATIEISEGAESDLIIDARDCSFLANEVEPGRLVILPSTCTKTIDGPWQLAINGTGTLSGSQLTIEIGGDMKQLGASEGTGSYSLVYAGTKRDFVPGGDGDSDGPGIEIPSSGNQ
jgi:hypothetical protein